MKDWPDDFEGAEAASSRSLRLSPSPGNPLRSTLGGDTRSFAQVIKALPQPKNSMNQRPISGRFRGGRGYGNRSNQWNQGYRERPLRIEEERREEAPRVGEGETATEEFSESIEKEQSANLIRKTNSELEDMREVTGDNRNNTNLAHNTFGICPRCGRPGHGPEACNNPVRCDKCGKEGHVERVCSEKMPWEYIAPFFGLSAYGQGFHFIQSAGTDEGIRDMSDIALITIIQGEATARQIESEFRLKAGPESSWTWYAKQVADKEFQMRFPDSKSIEDIAYFPEMRMTSLPSVALKVEKWNANAGSKGPLDTAWFRIRGIPYETRSYSKACLVASYVGVPLEVDKSNITEFDYVRVKIGCRDVTKVPATVDGVLDMHLRDFHFQREVEQGGFTNPAGNQCVRYGGEKANEDNPSSNKPKLGENTQSHNAEASTSKQKSNGKGQQVNEAEHKKA